MSPRLLHSTAVLGLCCLGCASGEVDVAGIPGPGADPGAGPDAGSSGASDGGVAGPYDAGPTADGAAASPTAAHLLLTEVVLTPSGAEFVELANLTAGPVDLSTYFLSDTDRYMYTPAGAGVTAAASSDFIARFPDGAVLQPGDVAVVAIDGAGFASAFGTPADFCVRGTGCTAMVHVDVGSTASLTNSGEPLVLFQWDGASDLVVDIDIVRAGTLSASNPMPDKTGGSCDGPDGDALASSYAADAATMPDMVAPGAGVSLKRIALEGSDESANGNGMGEDETSENILVTWDGPPYSEPSPGTLQPWL